ERSRWRPFGVYGCDQARRARASATELLKASGRGTDRSAGRPRGLRGGGTRAMGVKGSAIESVVADVNRLVEEGRLAREALAARLPAEDLQLLETKIVPALWYSYGSYGRLMELLFEIEGRRSTEYLVERGRRAGERVRAMGIYAQLKGDWSNWGERMGPI